MKSARRSPLTVSAIYAVLLRPLVFPRSEQLVTVAQFSPKLRQPFVAPVRLADWNRMNSTFQAISGYYIRDESELSGELPERLTRAFVASRFLQVWGIAPANRRDAFLAAAEIALTIERLVTATGSRDTVGTAGVCECFQARLIAFRAGCGWRWISVTSIWAGAMAY